MADGRRPTADARSRRRPYLRATMASHGCHPPTNGSVPGPRYARRAALAWMVSIALAGCGAASATGPGAAPAPTPATAVGVFDVGIHKIRHVVMIIQEN